MKSVMTYFVFLGCTFVACTSEEPYQAPVQARTKTDVSVRQVVDESHQDGFVDTVALATGWYPVLINKPKAIRGLEGSVQLESLDTTPIITLKHISSFRLSQADPSNDWALSMHLNKSGKAAWAQALGSPEYRVVGFVVDNQLLQVSKVTPEMVATDPVLSRNLFTKQELEEIKKVLESQLPQ